MDKLGSKDCYKDAGYQAKLVWNDHPWDDGGLYMTILGANQWIPLSEALWGRTAELSKSTSIRVNIWFWSYLPQIDSRSSGYAVFNIRSTFSSIVTLIYRGALLIA